MKFTPGRKAALAFAALIPVLTIGLGTFLICNGTLPTPALCITFFLIPAVVIALFWLLIGSGWKTWVKTLLCVGILLVYIPITGLAILVSPYAESNRYTGAQAIEQYASASIEIPSLPAPDTLGNPQNTVYQYMETSGLVYVSESHSLLCRYTPEDYAAQVESLDANWVFQSIPITYFEYTVQPEFSLDCFHFRFLSTGKSAYGLAFPYHMTLVGTNDNTKEIIWINYGDPDLDSLYDPAEFLIRFCGWNRLLK